MGEKFKIIMPEPSDPEIRAILKAKDDAINACVHRAEYAIRAAVEVLDARNRGCADWPVDGGRCERG